MIATTANDTRHVVLGEERRTCALHGDYTSQQIGLADAPASRWKWLQPFWSACPKCDAARQSAADAEHERIRSADAQRRKVAADRMVAMGVPRMYAEASLAQCSDKLADSSMPRRQAVYRWVQEYANSFDLALANGRSFAMIGGVGTGKTFLACSVLRHVVEHGGSVGYATVMDILGRIKATFRKDSPETEAQVFRELQELDLLVIDEVGRSLDTNYEVAQFFRLLNKRSGAMRPVILVSNLNGTEFRKFLGEAIVDRLRDNGGALLTFDWPSYRRGGQ